MTRNTRGDRPDRDRLIQPWSLKCSIRSGCWLRVGAYVTRGCRLAETRRCTAWHAHTRWPIHCRPSCWIRPCWIRGRRCLLELVGELLLLLIQLDLKFGSLTGNRLSDRGLSRSSLPLPRLDCLLKHRTARWIPGSAGAGVFWARADWDVTPDGCA